MNRFIRLTFITLLTFAFFSCDDDSPAIQCLEDNELGEVALSETSREFLPYENAEQILIFSNSLGYEFRGTYRPGEFDFALNLVFTELYQLYYKIMQKV